MPQPTITDAEMDAAIGATPLTEDNLRERSQALSDAQDTWEKVAWLSTEKIPCRECGGTGRVGSGSFGDVCVSCMGSRLESAPDAEDFQMPPFVELRAAITAYGNALADRALPDGHRAKKQLALPAPGSVPDLESINALHAQGKVKAKELKQLQLGAAGRGVDPRQLSEGKAASGFEGEGDLGDVDDAELDDLEDAATKVKNTDGPHKPTPKGKGKR